jgi:hypothetical protein
MRYGPCGRHRRTPVIYACNLLRGGTVAAPNVSIPNRLSRQAASEVNRIANVGDHPIRMRWTTGYSTLERDSGL